MFDAKKIADAVRLIREAYAPLVRTNTVCDGLTAIIDELDPPEPKTLLADAKVGDLCRLRNGGYTQIESVKGLGGKTWYDRTDRYTSYPDGRLFKGENNESDIIATEPLAEVGTAEWAWQMAKLGIETRCYEGKIKVSKSGLIEVCYNGMAYAMPLTQSPDNKAYTIKKISQCSPTGWQLYEEPEFNVGDFVKYDIDTYLRVIEPSGAVYKDKTLCKTLFGEIVGDGYPYTSCLTKASPSEVIVKIGCLKGTVEKAQDYAYFLLWHSKTDCDYSMIKWDALDTRTSELVESLLKAQEVRND